MDVLKPHIIHVGNRCYRQNPLKYGASFNPEEESFQEDLKLELNFADEFCDSTLDITETKRGLSLSLLVPDTYFKYIIGKKGETKKRMEAETQTQICVPKPGDRQQHLVIYGHERKGIVSAKTRIDVLIDSARQHQPFTHFLSIPVTSPDVIERFQFFKAEVLDRFSGEKGVDESLFQNPKRLHLTLGTLVLLNDNEIEKATSLLKACEEELIKPFLQNETLQVPICGLEYMNDDPAEVDVLYAKVQPGKSSQRLQELVDIIVNKFTSEGVVKREHDHVKMHVTVMNTLMRKDPSAISENQSAKHGIKLRESFDAREILKTFQDFNFGSQHIASIQLSQRHSTNVNGYYNCASYISLP
ncbi:unnamed protein product [Lymnaea stagnalis]|uniref:K Homology domain-containing protein n=1 Tax=Lymnaea stagnalis TaxID=6523 RepID=A0AAV2IHX4_LYMST